MDYFFHICVLVGIYVTLAVSLDLLVGHTGLLSLAHGAFFGIGAYSAALLSTRVGFPVSLSLVAAPVTAALLSVVVSMGSLRLRQERFVLLTLAFQILVVKVAMNWTTLTGGPLGIPGIPPVSFIAWTPASPIGFALLAGLLAILVCILVGRIVNSPYGRVLWAIREDEAYASALGKDTREYKIASIMVSASLAALAGAFYAHYITYIAPTDFGLHVSLLVISMVIIGGAATTWGPIIGATVLVLLPETLRFVGLGGPLTANVQQIAYGGLLVGLMLLRPQGLMGRSGFAW